MGRRTRRRTWRRVALALVVALATTYAGAWATTDRYGASRAIAWLEADTGDLHRFPARVVPAGDTPRALPPGPALDLAEAWGVDDPSAVLAATSTAALLVVHDGRLRVETYLGDTGPDTQRTSFSSVKSVVSTLVGLAVADGAITSLDQPVTDHVPELLERDPRFARITVRHLLTMSSGLRYEERGTPFSDDARTYYGTDLRAVALDAQVTGPPGERFLYNNYNLLLEGLVLERATGQRVSDLLAERLWQPMGAEADAGLSLDSTRSGFEKMESGLNAVPRDYARFGLLFAADGRVGDRQVLPEGWVARAMSRGADTGPNPAYGLHWWTGTFDGAPLPDGHAMAVGNFGQYVYVAPELDLVVVRLGDAYGDGAWPERFVRLAEHVAAGG